MKVLINEYKWDNCKRPKFYLDPGGISCTTLRDPAGISSATLRDPGGIEFKPNSDQLKIDIFF
jgi:hypothetical protein